MSVPPRTNNPAVQDVLTSRNYDGQTSLTPFVAAASAIVDRVVACAIKRGDGSYALSSVEAELVERWLAAHMYARNADQLYKSKNTKSSSATFQGETGLSLEATSFGQTAINLDISGCLAAIGKRQFASLTWLGKSPADQIPYIDRGGLGGPGSGSA